MPAQRLRAGARRLLKRLTPLLLQSRLLGAHLDESAAAVMVGGASGNDAIGAALGIVLLIESGLLCGVSGFGVGAPHNRPRQQQHREGSENVSYHWTPSTNEFRDRLEHDLRKVGTGFPKRSCSNKK
jgi:hypothetical protein